MEKKKKEQKLRPKEELKKNNFRQKEEDSPIFSIGAWSAARNKQH